MVLLNLIRKDKWPFYIAMLFLIASTLLLLHHVLSTTGGIFFLPHDETYLQLSTARTLAFRHIWGIGRNDFAAASPSLLNPLVLAAAFFIFGAQMAVAPFINAIVAIVLLGNIQRWLAKRAIAPLHQLFILLAVIILSPLPIMIVYGMESPLLLLLAFLFISRILDEWHLAGFSRQTLVYGALMIATRYDGVLLVGAVFLLLLWKRRWLRALQFAFWCLLPVLIFGFISLFKGSFFLPNAFTVQSLGSFLSYDWLVGCAVAISVPLLQDRFITHSQKTVRFMAGMAIAIIVLIIMTTNLYAVRALGHSRLITYKIKYPVARFAHRYYYYSNIISDDIGMISFFTNGRYLDLSGLATAQIARSRVDSTLSPALVDHLSRQRDGRLAIIGQHFGTPLPDHWIKMASWEISGTQTWSFYAIDTFAAAYFKRCMTDYAPLLYPDVQIKYFYLRAPEKNVP